jgi:hypothetical protein
MSERYEKVIAAINTANAADPQRVVVDGSRQPSEIVYARRMSLMLDRIYPEATELLRIAAYAQHIERWTSPRSSYPAGRIGYLRWRTDLKNYHAERAGKMMAECGYDSGEVARTQALIRKERMKYDTEAQALEDVICLVFLEDYLANFALKHDKAKVIDILRKTWIKMSPKGQAAASTLSLPEHARRLVEDALQGAA